MTLILFHDKHDTRYCEYATEAQRDAVCLAILNERHAEGWYQDDLTTRQARMLAEALEGKPTA